MPSHISILKFIRLWCSQLLYKQEDPRQKNILWQPSYHIFCQWAQAQFLLEFRDLSHHVKSNHQNHSERQSYGWGSRSQKWNKGVYLPLKASYSCIICKLSRTFLSMWLRLLDFSCTYPLSHQAYLSKKHATHLCKSTESLSIHQLYRIPWLIQNPKCLA